MLCLTVVHVGDLKESFFCEAVAEYEKRLSAFCRVTDKEIKEAPLCDTPSEAKIAEALEKEGAAILAALPKRSHVTALCVEGAEMTSEKFASFVEDAINKGGGNITFVIGSSHGLSETVKRAADARVSFSRMTFPHRLMRVILAEQIYRAFTITAGKKYHK